MQKALIKLTYTEQQRNLKYTGHGVRYGGGQGAMAPQFLKKINEFLKFTIDF